MSSTSSPSVLTQEVFDRLGERWSAEQAKAEPNSGGSEAIVREVLVPHLALVHAAKWALGREIARDASSEQMNAYTAAFEQFTIRSASNVVGPIQNYKITVCGETRTSDTTTNVKVRIENPQADSPLLLTVKWKYASKTDQWLVVDLDANGIEYQTTTKKQISDMLKSAGSFDGLVQMLQQRGGEQAASAGV
ncbi:MlaC/ttg2D family ABC transporter substrate-binding protein [Streptomyces sp. NPDC004436]